MELTKTITLKKPLAAFSELTLREPTVDEIAQFEADSAKFGAVRALKSLISKIGQVEIADAGQLGARDVSACQRFIECLREVSAEELLEGDEAMLPLQAPIPGVAEVKLREPTLDEIARLAGDRVKLGAVAAMRNLVAAMNKLEAKVVGRMGIHDFAVCDKYLEGFFD